MPQIGRDPTDDCYNEVPENASAFDDPHDPYGSRQVDSGTWGKRAQPRMPLPVPACIR